MKVKFVPQNVEFEIDPGKSVMHVAQDNGLYIKSVCKGVPSCAECRVRVIEGEHNVMPPGSEELSLIGSGHFIDRRRLSCQLKCFGDITVDMSEQVAKQQGIQVGRKTKTVLKDDRVEEAVARRSENVVDEESSVDANDDVAHQHAAAPSRDPRDAREPRETRDTRPQRDRGQRGGGGGGDRSPKGARGPVPQKPGGGLKPGAGPNVGGAQVGTQEGGAREGGAKDVATGAGGGGAKRKRRRRGKGGGGGGSGSSPGGSPSGGPGRAPSGGAPSRPGSSS